MNNLTKHPMSSNSKPIGDRKLIKPLALKTGGGGLQKPKGASYKVDKLCSGATNVRCRKVFLIGDDNNLAKAKAVCILLTFLLANSHILYKRERKRSDSLL